MYISSVYICEHFIVVCILCNLLSVNRYDLLRDYISSPWLGTQQRVALYLSFFLLDIENTDQTGKMLVYVFTVRTGDFVTLRNVCNFSHPNNQSRTNGPINAHLTIAQV